MNVIDSSAIFKPLLSLFGCTWLFCYLHVRVIYLWMYLILPLTSYPCYISLDIFDSSATLKSLLSIIEYFCIFANSVYMLSIFENICFLLNRNTCVVIFVSLCFILQCVCSIYLWYFNIVGLYLNSLVSTQNIHLIEYLNFECIYFLCYFRTNKDCLWAHMFPLIFLLH